MKTISTIETAKGRLLYTLFSELMDGTERFGVTVSSKIFGDEEVVSVRDITTDPAFAEKIAFMLADNLVLPSTLTEVIEECIAAEFTV
ncbi:MAG: hypothetical protein J1E40_08400 [Oscillospiraceae bacterium]|nr:hypothetical protein [Oscillospiraceae bacterium]